jgi:hypothetical protein
VINQFIRFSTNRNGIYSRLENSDSGLISQSITNSILNRGKPKINKIINKKKEEINENNLNLSLIILLKIENYFKFIIYK